MTTQRQPGQSRWRINGLQQQGWRGNILALIAGALVTLSLAPFDIWPLGILSCALLAWLLTDLSPRQAALRGWCYGFGLFSSGASWVYVSIHVYGYLPIPLAILTTAIFTAGLGLFCSLTFYLYARWVRPLSGGQWLGFAAMFVLGEWWRSWFLTGFPWLYLGYSHLESPLAGWAPVSGIFGLSFIIALSGAVLTQCLLTKKLQLKPSLLAISLWLTGVALTQVDWVQPADHKPVSVAMVQANIPQSIKWQREQLLPTLNLYRNMSEPLWQQHDIVIWPEAAVPTYYQNAEDFLDGISKRAKASHSTLITGIPYFEQKNNTVQRYNSIMGFGEGGGSYFKQRLVPFGEYVPLENLLGGLLRFFELPLSNFSSGSNQQKGISAGNLLLAPFICYEVVYPELVADWLPEADLLITISNDAWFGASIGPLQHLQMAQMRALESGRYMLRSTGTGISAIINQRGEIVSRGAQFSREVITGEAKIYRGTTPFSLTGSTPTLLLCASLIILPLTISLRAKPVKMRD